MIEEKENNLDTNNVGSRLSNLESECRNVGLSGGPNSPTKCFKDVTIAYITSGNALNNNVFRRIGVVLSGEIQANENFILELGFKTSVNTDFNDPIRKIHYYAMIDFLEEALLTGGKVDICVNSKDSNGYRIIDVALKKMTVEKENKLDKNHISFRATNIEEDCTYAGEVRGQDNRTECFKDVTVVYISSGNAKGNTTIRQVGLLLNGETEVKDNCNLELGFKTWQDIDTDDPIRQIHYYATMELLKKAVLTGIKVDICASLLPAVGYKILDVSLHNS